MCHGVTSATTTPQVRRGVRRLSKQPADHDLVGPHRVPRIPDPSHKKIARDHNLGQGEGGGGEDGGEYHHSHGQGAGYCSYCRQLLFAFAYANGDPFLCPRVYGLGTTQSLTALTLSECRSVRLCSTLAR